MAAPELSDGFTRIANELLEALCRTNLSSYESRVFRAIERKTFGYGKKVDKISIRQLSSLTGLDYRHVHRALTSLARRDFIVIKNEPGRTSTIGIQKDYEKWDQSTDASSGVTYTGVTSIDDTTDTSIGIGSDALIDDNKRKKKVLKKPPEEISSLRQRYSNFDLIDKAFQAFASTRKTNKVASSVLLAQLQKWEQYTVPCVEEAIQAYLEKDYAGQGKDEKYLLGIMRHAKGRNNSSMNQADESWMAGAI